MAKEYSDVTVPIGESDLPMFQGLVFEEGQHFEWSFHAEDGRLINITFIKE